MNSESGFQLKNPTALYYFNEVVKAGSFRAASEATHIAASAINRQIKNLEDEMDAPLFERGRGRSGLKLTSAGEILVHHVRVAMSELTTAKVQVDSLKGLRRGHIRLGVNEGFGRELFHELMLPFNRDFPNVTFEIIVASSPRLAELTLADEVDLSIAYNLKPIAGLRVHSKCNVNSCVMLTRDHPLASKSSVKLTDCAPYGFVLPHASLALRPTLDLMFQSVGMKPRVLLTTDSYELMRTAASAGIGIAIVSQYLLGRDMYYPDAVFVPVRDQRVKKQVIACTSRKERHLSIAALKLIERVNDVLNKRAKH